MADRNSRAFVPLQERKERREERERRERSAAAARETFVTPAMALGEDRLPYPVERLSSELGWVYFIQASCGSIKIGRAANVRYRLAELQCANPRKLTLVAVALDGSREREYHRRFAAHRLHGEWFEPHPDILAEIERLAPPVSPDGHRAGVRR